MTEIDPENPFEPSTHDGDGGGEKIPLDPIGSGDTDLDPLDHHDTHKTSFGGDSETDSLLPNVPGKNPVSRNLLKSIWPDANLNELKYDFDNIRKHWVSLTKENSEKISFNEDGNLTPKNPWNKLSPTLLELLGKKYDKIMDDNNKKIERNKSKER